MSGSGTQGSLPTPTAVQRTRVGAVEGESQPMLGKDREKTQPRELLPVLPRTTFV